MENHQTSTIPRCWICDSEQLTLIRRSNIPSQLTSRNFAITDSSYGTTGEIQRCKNCGFLQCSNLDNTLQYYENLEDVSYDQGRTERGLQAKKLLKIAQKYKPGGRLLDVGAGSGILVEQAIQLGYKAEGIEPSKWLQSQAQNRGLPVYAGTIPHPQLTGPYDVVTVIDVIEHVPYPVTLLGHVSKLVEKDGIVLVVTPNVNSFMARVFGWKWWHFRIAHIGYFNKKTLRMAIDKAGFEQIRLKSACWYFTAHYLFERLNKYLPSFLRMPAPSFLKKIIIPLNLMDSMLGIYSLKKDKYER